MLRNAYRGVNMLQLNQLLGLLFILHGTLMEASACVKQHKILTPVQLHQGMEKIGNEEEIFPQVHFYRMCICTVNMPTHELNVCRNIHTDTMEAGSTCQHTHTHTAYVLVCSMKKSLSLKFDLASLTRVCVCVRPLCVCRGIQRK